jgi:L-ascorbate metabolism protein UlaG (beta-lactamase superfamily)
MRTRLLLAAALSTIGLAAAQDQFPAPDGAAITITPLLHASVQLEHRGTVIQVDPWSAADLSMARRADLILITDDPVHHLDPKAIERLRKPGAPVVITAAGRRLIPDGVVLAIGEKTTQAGVPIEAIAAYDLIEGEPSHPKGQSNGYVVTLGGTRVYFAGVTECVPELKALKNIDVAFLPMNIPPGRMPPAAAAACARALAPKVVYTYHYDQTYAARITNPRAVAQSLPDGLSVAQSLDRFATALAGSGIEFRRGNWYPARDR